jgi:hypothetical protein
MKVRTPVALLIFNRPETTAQVFKVIRKARPETLLIIADGPRPDRPEEANQCRKTREIVTQVDWPCEVLKNYSDTNLGCKKRVSTGLDWVFNTVEEAIILEDDCLPDANFFTFCEEMLVKYRHDERIGHISGTNLNYQHELFEESYCFSRYPNIWGWATWRRAWQDYDADLKLWPQIKAKGVLRDVFVDKRLTQRWVKIFDRVHDGMIDTWDYQWSFSCMIQNRLVIAPSVNMISNIGFGDSATHTIAITSSANLPTKAMSFPLQHPQTIIRNRTFDQRIDLLNFPPSKWKRTRRLLHKLQTLWSC